MANGLGNIVNAISDTPTRRAILALGLQLDAVDKSLSVVRRNNREVTSYALDSITLTAGAGLTGGGDLTTDRTIAVGAGTGITVAADSVSISSSYLGANPTGTIGVSAVNGSATTYMRSDAAPAFDMTITRNWTAGVHTFTAQDVHNGGISLGTSGAIVSAVADGPSAIGYDFNDATRTQGFARKLRQGATALEEVTWDGRYSFGYGNSVGAQVGHVLGFLANDANSPTGAPAMVGILSLIQHTDTAESPTKALGLVGAHYTETATGASYGFVNAVRGVVTTKKSISGLSAKQQMCFHAAFANVPTLGTLEPTSSDPTFSGANSMGGDWGHLSGFWCDFYQISSTTLLSTTKPAIMSSARLPIQYYNGSNAVGTPANQSWGVYGDDPGTGTAQYPAVTGFMRVPYPRKTGGTGVRAMQLYWEPWPNTATIRGGAAEGDTYFDDNTNFSGGLWEFNGIAGGANAWNYLLNSPGIDAPGGGAAATLGTIGGTGPAAAAQATWIQVNCADNVVRWVPAWV